MAKKNKKKSSFFSDFKKFISRGSVIDLAVGVVIGSSFTAIVNGIVKGLIMPLVGLIVGDGLNGLYFAVGATGELAAESMTTSNGVVIEVIPFSSCPQSLPASESFPMSQLFA